jgi:hypothetical protein
MTLTLTNQADEAQRKVVKRAVLYLRVASIDRQDQQGEIGEQRQVCTREAEQLGVVVAAEYMDADGLPRRAR